jgi:hypothetical protein
MVKRNSISTATTSCSRLWSCVRIANRVSPKGLIALCLFDGVNGSLAKASGNTTLAQSFGDTPLAKASGDDHGSITNNSVPCANTDNIIGLALSSDQHYKNNNNSLGILAVMCCGIKANDGGEIVDFNVDPWNSLNRST